MMKHNRRTFIRLANLGIFALIVLLWNKLTLRHIHAQKKKERVLPLNPNKPVSFFNNYIVIQKEGETIVFSSECTHLGCKIREIKQGRLVCPCHGSEYNLNGVPVKGPAFKPLEKIPSIISKDNKSIELII